MNGRDYSIRLSAFEAGCLHGAIMGLDDRKQQALKFVSEQLVILKKRMEEDAGVKKEIIPGSGWLKITDKDGNLIIRPPYPFELGGGIKE